MVQIRKKGFVNFFHYWDGLTTTAEYGASDLVITFDGNIMYLRATNGRVIFLKDGFNYSDVEVYDDTTSQSWTSFSSVVELQQILIDLGHPAYAQQGAIVQPENFADLNDVEITSPTTGQVPVFNEVSGKWENGSTSGTGDVTGPASSTDNHIAVFNGTTGKIIKDSNVPVTDLFRLESQIGKSTYFNVVATPVLNINIATTYQAFVTSDDDLEINFTNLPIETSGYYRRLDIVLPATKVLTIPQATEIIGTIIADGTTINRVDLYFANYDTAGLRIVAVVNGGDSSSGVESVTGDSVDNADPLNPVVLDRNPDTYNIKEYGVLGDGIDLVDGNITSSDNTFTSATASFSSADIGKIIVIRGAGTAGNYFKTTIASINSTTSIELTDSAITTVSNAVFFYGTDDTDAIQTAINYVSNNGGGRIIIPEGVYIIDGELKNDVGENNIDYNSQIYIPYQKFSDRNRTTITLETNVITNGQHAGVTAGRRGSNGGSVFRSTITGSGINPSIIASRGFSESGNLEGYNALTVHFKGVNFQYTPYGNVATIGGLNWAYGYNIVGEDLSIIPFYMIHLESNEHNVIDVSGVTLPKRASGAFNRLKGCWIAGFTNGIVLGDHGYLYDNHTAGCVNGLRFDEMFHHAYVYGHLSQWNKIQVLVNEESYFHIHDLDIEVQNESHWTDYEYLLVDESNLGHGIINYHMTRAFLGYNNNNEFARLGGDKVLCKPVTFEDSSSLTVVGSTDSEKLENLLITLKNLGHIFYTPLISLLTYYRFNNDLVDQISSLNGTGTSIGYAVGKGGDALDLSGGSSYVTIADDDTFSFVSSPWSVSFLLYLDTVSGVQTVINKRDASSNSEWVVQVNAGIIRVFLFSGVGNFLQINCSTTLSTSTWYKIDIADGGGNTLSDKKVYVNKVAETLNSTGSGGTYTGMANTIAPIYIGTAGQSLGTNSLNGRVQRLAIWNGELKQTQIDYNYETEFTNENDLA